MAYNEYGKKSRSSNKKKVRKYKANKGADFDDAGTGNSYTTKSIKVKTKYDKKGEIKKIKRVKKTEGGGRMVTVSKLGVENNSLSPKGSIGLVTTREKTNTAFDNPRAGSNGSALRMKSMVDKVKNISSNQFDRKLKKANPDSVKKDVYFPQTGARGEANKPKIAFGDPGSVISRETTTFTKGNKEYTKTHNSSSGVTSYSKRKMK